MTNKRYLMADERGSIVNVSDASGNMLAINKYDEYGIPASTNIGRFGYNFGDTNFGDTILNFGNFGDTILIRNPDLPLRIMAKGKETAK